ncbi:MAG: prepilin-type N-terminal cleavage/methylation domain-containing protein [Planctomycetaceae bacterium]
MTARVAPRGHDIRPAPGRPLRAGFTLIELMIVIVIIVMLIALLVPAIGAAMRNAREGQVKQEIGQLEYAIADFKTQFGINPPSYIDLQLYDPSDYTTPILTGTALKPATQATLRRLWPNINMAALITDLQTNTAKQQELGGSQCLVFFLGGLVPPPATPDDKPVPVGFSNNPRSPLALGGKRVGPFFEFRADRLYDADPATFNGYEGYLDPLPGQQLPYFYVTSDRYATQDTYNANTSPQTPADLVRPVYRQSASSYFNAQSFQIISPGPDGVTGVNNAAPGSAYGSGGIFDVKKGTLVDVLPTGHPYDGLAKGDADNITNFHGGRLVP